MNEEKIMESQPTIHVMIGLPRSGKSTYVKNFLRKNLKCVVVSADQLRYLVYGQQFFAGGEDLV